MSLYTAFVLIALIIAFVVLMVSRELIQARQSQKEWEHCQVMANLGYSQRIVIVTRMLRHGREISDTITAWVPKDFTGRASEDVIITADGSIPRSHA